MGRLLMRRRSRSLLVLGLSLLAFAATGGRAHAAGVSAVRAHAALLTPGAVFTETNLPAGNAVLAFNRAADGTLTPAGSFPTGGAGHTPNPPEGFAPLDSAGPLQLARDGRGRDCLFAVNAGSDTVSSFRVRRSGLELADQKPTNGSRPISVTSMRIGGGDEDDQGDDDEGGGKGFLVLYVLNSDDGSASIQGYWVAPWCALTPIPGSFHPTTSPTGYPAQISFNLRGTVLAVSERYNAGLGGGRGDIDIFPVDHDGVAGTPTVNQTFNNEPYGLAWTKHDILTVSEGAFPAIGASTASTYRLVGTTLVHLDTKPSPGAACWNRITKDDRFLYVSNPGGHFFPPPAASETAYSIGKDGTLTQVDGKPTNHSATDNALSHDSKFLYVLSNQLFPPAPVSAINEFRLDHKTGVMTPIGSIELPGTNTHSGLAAW